MDSHSNDDQLFLDHLIQIVEESLYDEHFGVSELAHKMRVSRSRLYVRVKALTQKSVSRLIREIRLNKALDLLKETNLSVSEIAYEVGFGSPTYFNKCFHDQFGYPPGEAKNIRPEPGTKAESNASKNRKSLSKLTKSKMVKPFYLILLVVIILSLSFLLIKPVIISPEISEQSLAILPFKNLSDDPVNQYFSEGVMESIQENLKIIRNLKMISRTSAERYGDNSEKSLSQIANELEVRNILEGSVQKNGDQVRIWVKLIEVGKTEELVWSEQYDRHISDLFKIQNEIAQQIAISLRIILTPEEKRIWLGVKDPTKSMEAWDLFMRATQPIKESKADYEQSIRMLEQAIVLDPDFGRAYGNLGANLYKLKEFGASKRIWRDSAIAMIQKSIAFNPERSTPYRYLAGIYKWLGDENKEYKCYIKGLDNYPSDYFIMRQLAHFYERKGEFEKAIDLELENLSIDIPSEDEVNYFEKIGKLFQEVDWQLSEKYFKKSLEIGYGTHYVLRQLYKSAFRERDFRNTLNYALKLKEIAPEKYTTNEALGFAWLLNNHYEKAEEYFEKAAAIRQNMEEDFSYEDLNYRLHLAFVKKHSGEEAEAQKIIDDNKIIALAAIKNKSETGDVSMHWFSLARIYAFEGETSPAIEALEKWFQTEPDKRTANPLQYLLADPFFDSIRENEEFQNIVHKLLDREAENRKLLRVKLKEYHKRGELKWLKI